MPGQARQDQKEGFLALREKEKNGYIHMPQRGRERMFEGVRERVRHRPGRRPQNHASRSANMASFAQLEKARTL